MGFIIFEDRSSNYQFAGTPHAYNSIAAVMDKKHRRAA